jgi:hypothetical protein
MICHLRRRWTDYNKGLSCLRELSLCVLHLSSDEVHVLGELPLLVYANFEVLDVSQDKVLLGTGLFPVLVFVWFTSDGDVSAYLSFEPGAMPKLQTLCLGFGWDQWRGATPVGMECLPCHQQINLWLHVTGAESSKNQQDVQADMESAFKNAASVHPGHPSVIVR